MTSFYQFQEKFPDDAACLHQIMVSRYGGTRLECPKCKRDSKFHRMKHQRNYVCQYCGHHIYPCVGTPMERSRISLHKWFFAIFLFSTSRHGVAAKELQRQLKVTYKTAWRMAHEIRKYMAEVDGEVPLGGLIEADETYIGGRVHGQGQGCRKKPVIRVNVKAGSTIHTDDLRSYLRLTAAGYKHEVVNHSAGEYARGSCHVNSVEGFWSRLKNSIRGTHIHVSRKHLWKYAKEFEYRYNRRKQPALIFSDLVASL